MFQVLFSIFEMRPSMFEQDIEKSYEIFNLEFIGSLVVLLNFYVHYFTSMA